MTFLVITIDGTLHLREQPPTYEALNAEVGEGGRDQVPLALAEARGFVNDLGHVTGLARNVVGSLLLMCCGAAQQPYAGPVVLTGWDRHAWEDSEIRPLPPDLLDALPRLHADIRAVLDDGRPSPGCTPEWVAQVREAAAYVLDAPTPRLAVVRGWPR